MVCYPVRYAICDMISAVSTWYVTLWFALHYSEFITDYDEETGWLPNTYFQVIDGKQLAQPTHWTTTDARPDLPDRALSTWPPP